MKGKVTIFSVILLCILFLAKEADAQKKGENWQKAFEEQLPQFGHRNWILVVDKAFPMLNAAGLTTIYTNENLMSVLAYTMIQINRSSHVKPIIYTDKELKYITPDLVLGIEDYRNSLLNQLEKEEPMVMLHDSIFVKIDQAAKQFKVLVLKTNETIPYSSVFIYLDCKYWNSSKENQLRKDLFNNKNH